MDAWLLTGGFDEGRADQALEMAGLVAAARGGSRQPVIWAGSAALAGRGVALFEDGAVQVVDNPRPERAHREPAAAAPCAGGAAAAHGRARRRAAADACLVPPRRRRAGPRRPCARMLGVDLGAHYLTWALR